MCRSISGLTLMRSRGSRTVGGAWLCLCLYSIANGIIQAIFCSIKVSVAMFYREEKRARSLPPVCRVKQIRVFRSHTHIARLSTNIS